MMSDTKDYDRLFAITVSKNYANELSIMLDNNAKYFDKWYIATQEDDVKTIELIKSKNLSNVEIVYYPMDPRTSEEHHAKSPLVGSDSHFSYPYWLKKPGRRSINPKVKRSFKLTFDKGGAIRTIQKYSLPKENPTENDLILLLDSDIILPKNFQESLNSETLELGTLHGARRKDFLFYSDFVEDKNAKSYNSFDLAGYFHLYKYDSSRLCKRTHDCSWVDYEFKRQFSTTKIISDMTVSHLGAAGVNWEGKESETFIMDGSVDKLKKFADVHEVAHCDDLELLKKNIMIKMTAKQLASLKHTSQFPSFIIPGFQKCGSTSLKNNLMQHTNIEFGHGFNSELNYCANEEYFPSNWHHNHMWYLRHFHRDGTLWADHCNTLFNRGWKTSIDRMRTTYVAKLTGTIQPRKFIVMIRNPINRAFSEYNHFMQEFPASHSYCWEAPGFSFLENIKSELLAIDELKKQQADWYNLDTGTNGRLIINGVYAPILKHFKKELELNEETLKVITLESLVKDPTKIFNDIFEFLQTEPQEINLRKYNSFDTGDRPDTESLNILKEFYEPYNNDLFDFLGYEIEEWS